MPEVRLSQVPAGFCAGLVHASGVQPSESPAELQQLAQRVSREAVNAGLGGGEARRAAIRRLLRQGGYRPAGRNKPAQEYLLRTIQQQGALPQILNVVDLINLVSVQSGLPISLVGLDRLGAQLELRLGKPGEQYVFNTAGQQLDLEGLLCLCRVADEGSQPAAAPVKDSLWAKVMPDDRELLACIYASREAVAEEELQRWLDTLADGFRRWCCAQPTRRWILSAS